MDLVVIAELRIEDEADGGAESAHDGEPGGKDGEGEMVHVAEHEVIRDRPRTAEETEAKKEEGNDAKKEAGLVVAAGAEKSLQDEEPVLVGGELGDAALGA